MSTHQAEPAGAPLTPLTAAVRHRVVTLACDALGDVPVTQVPAGLRPFIRFTPPRRARAAGPTVLTALDADPAFRDSVATRVRAGDPALADALAAGTVPAAADPVEVAALAFLLRPDGWEHVLAISASQAPPAAGTDAMAEEVTRLQRQLTAARSQARADAERLRGELRAVKADNAALRHRLREAREAAASAEDAARTAAQAAQADRAAGTVALAAADAELRRTRQRLAEVERAAETARRSAREGRNLDDARLRLLLDAAVEATAGLRRELALPPVSVRPGDVVAPAPDEAAAPDVSTRARAVDDPALLEELLRLPQVHLIVDGYNVTKTGYGGLPLEAQRQRLVSGLATLAARSAVEVTVCWDAAGQEQRPLTRAPLGVRVLFSAPGQLADDLVRDLVRAEPVGRPLVVVSDDREVVDGVVAMGARAMASTALLRRLARV